MQVQLSQKAMNAKRLILETFMDLLSLLLSFKQVKQNGCGGGGQVVNVLAFIPAIRVRIPLWSAIFIW